VCCLARLVTRRGIGVARLCQYIILNSVLAFLVIWILYRYTEPIFIAAFLGAWPAFIIAVYDRFVNVPILNARDRGVHKDSLQVMDRGGVTWNFLRLSITNSGFAVARNCTAELRVLKRPLIGDQSCPAPYDEPKGLKWSGSNPKEPRSIPSRKGEAIIDVLLDDTTMPHATRSSWHANDTWGPLVCWAATHDVYLMQPVQRSQDAFCQGDYEVEIVVYPENGSPKALRYKLHIDVNWGRVSLIPL
jgi:hypothetical protein